MAHRTFTTNVIFMARSESKTFHRKLAREGSKHFAYYPLNLKMTPNIPGVPATTLSITIRPFPEYSIAMGFRGKSIYERHTVQHYEHTIPD
jgi:hypothetical protein